MKMLDKTFGEGDTVIVDFEKDRIIFTKEVSAQVSVQSG
jgi:hypothetical protein